MTPDGKKQNTPATPVKPRPWLRHHTPVPTTATTTPKGGDAATTFASLSKFNEVSRLTKRPRPLRGAPGMTMDSRQGDEARLNRGWGLR
jgi:hypothetical protein